MSQSGTAGRSVDARQGGRREPDTRRQQDAQRRQQAEAELLARWGEAKISPSRDRILRLLDLLGQPQRSYRAIHLTGTNGKTSTARMVAELLRGFGLRTGSYTSPHLSGITERIVLDGQPVSDGVFADAYSEIAPYLDLVDADSGTRLTFFEALTGLAFAVFADAPVDVAVVEVGMGGAWDATNVLNAQVAVVLPIGLDHTEYLGDTIAKIATEKAGIIHAGASAILAAQPTEAAGELLRRAAEVQAAVAREGLEFGVLDRSLAVGGQLLTLQGLGGVYEQVFLPLHGAYQAQNAACALAAVEAFFGAGARTGPIDVEIVRSAFAGVSSPGRLEAVRSAPTVLVDASHNPAGMTATVQALAEGFDFRRLVGVVAMLAGKDALGTLEVLEPALDEVVVSQNSSPRAMDVDELAAIAVEVFGEGRVSVEPRLDDALEAAVRLAEEDATGVLSGAGVLVTGSVVTAGEARTLLTGNR
ncbi:MAG: bifunctional folylpolyglutamate synthase/dihydrofolate synthase [Jatrophihabitantaceae bacterium]